MKIINFNYTNFHARREHLKTAKMDDVDELSALRLPDMALKLEKESM